MSTGGARWHSWGEHRPRVEGLLQAAGDTQKGQTNVPECFSEGGEVS